MGVSEAVDVVSEPFFDSDVKAQERAHELGEEYFIAPVVTS
jgi:hypothetical protein